MRKFIPLMMATLFVAMILADYSCTSSKTEREVLIDLLRKVEKMASASYDVRTRSWLPGDTVATESFCHVDETANPSDSTLGVCFASYRDGQLFDAYDGTALAYYDHESKIIDVHDFAHSPLPFRPVSAPFFSYVRSIVDYALTTSDSIRCELTDSGDVYLLRLTICEKEQVEFFGRAYHMPVDPLFASEDPTSVYDIWVEKANGMPFKIRRRMVHNTTELVVSNVKINLLTPADFDIYSLVGDDYIAHLQSSKSQKQVAETALIGQPAPQWTLLDHEGREHSLSDIKSELVLLNVTGIGCGPCRRSTVFLNSLTERYTSDQLAVVSIDTWGREPHSIEAYIRQNGLKYPLLQGTSQIVDDYQTSAVPVFFLIDRSRTIRHAFFGYSEGLDTVIVNALDSLLR